LYNIVGYKCRNGILSLKVNIVYQSSLYEADEYDDLIISLNRLYIDFENNDIYFTINKSINLF